MTRWDYFHSNGNGYIRREYEMLPDGQDFGDYLTANGIPNNEVGDTYYVLDLEGKPTGESYQILMFEERN